MKYKIQYNKETCIGAATCISVAPKLWELEKNGKAKLLNSKYNKKTKLYELTIETEEEIEAAIDSAQVCPVNAIKITKIK